jgi:hypothetical protein
VCVKVGVVSINSLIAASFNVIVIGDDVPKEFLGMCFLFLYDLLWEGKFSI